LPGEPAADRCSRRVLVRLLLVPLSVVALPCAAQAVTAAAEDSGEILLMEGTQLFTSVSCGVLRPDGIRASQEDARGVTDTISTANRRTLSATLRVPGGRARVAISESVVGAGPRRLEVAYRFAADKAALPNGICVSIALPCDRYAGRQIALLDARGQALAGQALPKPCRYPRPSERVWCLPEHALRRRARRPGPSPGSPAPGSRGGRARGVPSGSWRGGSPPPRYRPAGRGGPACAGR
jgi:hypothetical protein